MRFLSEAEQDQGVNVAVSGAGDYLRAGFLLGPDTFGAGKFRIFRDPGTFTFTVPDGITRLRTRTIGAGSCGVSKVSGSTTGATTYPGYGGAGGGFAIGEFDVVPGAQYTVVVGQGGQVAGQSGGTSSFGSLISATGATGAVAGVYGTPGTPGAPGVPGHGVGGYFQASGGYGGTDVPYIQSTTNTANGGACGGGAAGSLFGDGGIGGGSELGVSSAGGGGGAAIGGGKGRRGKNGKGGIGGQAPFGKAGVGLVYSGTVTYNQDINAGDGGSAAGGAAGIGMALPSGYYGAGAAAPDGTPGIGGGGPGTDGITPPPAGDGAVVVEW